MSISDGVSYEEAGNHLNNHDCNCNPFLMHTNTSSSNSSLNAHVEDESNPQEVIDFESSFQRQKLQKIPHH
jgi:hypothetical protein